MKNKILKMSFIILNLLFIIPSLIYLIQNKTVFGYNIYYNFFITEQINKILSTSIYLLIFITIFIIYLLIIKQKEIFKNIKQIILFVVITSFIYMFMLPWTSSDIFYYMGVGELDGVYHQNPYYMTMEDFYEQNKENIDDEILEKGANNYWANTTVVYGPIAQLIFKICSTISFKNIDIALLVYKLVNICVHIGSCYLIYKITNRKKFALIYGINPFILLEGIGNVHNDIIIVFFVLLTLYFLIKKKNIYLSILFLAIATGIKYFTILLLPVIILYHFRNEKKLGKRFLRCIQYGIIFLVIFLLEYIMYFKDLNVLFAMMAQTERYAKSIYSVIIQKSPDYLVYIRASICMLFILYYLKMFIDILTEKNIKIYKIMKKYNISIILFLLILTNFQQWYLIWLFATMMWQKSYMIRGIISISAITEIANSIYMFKAESYLYDTYFVGIIVVLFIIAQFCTMGTVLKVQNAQKGHFLE